MAGFGADRVALGCHDDIWARAVVIDDGTTRLAITVVDLVEHPQVRLVLRLQARRGWSIRRSA
jgi:hypothetical protein